MHVNRGAIPATRHRDEPVGRCRRSCCWTPYVCAKNRQCDCHKETT